MDGRIPAAKAASIPTEQADRPVVDPLDTRLGPWRIWFYSPPVPYCDWHFQHEDDDGPGSPGWMSGTHATRDECLEAIIIHYEERGS